MALSVTTFFLIERPAIRFSSPRLAIGLLGSTFFIAIVAQVVIWGEGFRDRPPFNRNPANFNYSYRHSCLPLTNQPNNDDYCNLGTGVEGASTILIGDSHANAFATTFDALAKRHPEKTRFYQLGRGQCPILRGYGFPDCKEFSRIALDQISNSPQVKTVFWIVNWGHYLNGFNFRGFQDPDGSKFIEAFERTAQELSNSGKRIVFVYAVPLVKEPKRCAERPIHFNSKKVCTDRELSDVLSWESDYRTRLESALKGKDGFSTFDPQPIFCNDKICQVRQGERYLYNDFTHLSSYGGELIVEHAGEKLLRLIE